MVMATYEDYCKRRGIPYNPVEEPIVIFEDEPVPVKKKAPEKKKAPAKKKPAAKKASSAAKSKAKKKA
tara:strand:- start:3618 stop:3821 length:204 start_codon:yes stop_codon:yes gene_type:complete